MDQKVCKGHGKKLFMSLHN